MDKFQAFTWTSKKHGMLPNDLTGPDHLNTDLCIRPPTNHPPSSVDSHVIEVAAPCLCHNRRQT
jgi:hypothetical protein